MGGSQFFCAKCKCSDKVRFLKTSNYCIEINRLLQEPNFRFYGNAKIITVFKVNNYWPLYSV